MTRFWLAVVLIGTLVLSSCSLFREALDKRSGLSEYLQNTENSIRQEEWQEALQSLRTSQKAWKKVKPFMQVDVDHDYINDIEDNFVSLEAFIASQDMALSLQAILLLQKNWESIGEM